MRAKPLPPFARVIRIKDFFQAAFKMSSNPLDDRGANGENRERVFASCGVFDEEENKDISLRDALYDGDWDAVKRFMDKCKVGPGAVKKGDNKTVTVSGTNQHCMRLLVAHRICERLYDEINDGLYDNS